MTQQPHIVDLSLPYVRCIGAGGMTGKTVTRVDLSEAVYSKVGLSRTESAAFVELVLKEITDCLERGETVKLSSFGTRANALAATPRREPRCRFRRAVSWCSSRPRFSSSGSTALRAGQKRTIESFRILPGVGRHMNAKWQAQPAAI